MTTSFDPKAYEATLREVIEQLASIERGPGSEGEAEAARWIAARLTAAGAPAEIEPASYYDGYAKPIAQLSAIAAFGALLATRRHTRGPGALIAGAAGLLIADDISNAKRFFRRLSAPRATQNVVAVAGDPSAQRTLVVLAHHDAAPTGAIFDQTLQHKLGRLFPGILERIDTSTPLWWLVLAGPALAMYGGLRGCRRAAGLGLMTSLTTVAAMADVMRSPIVPGANDNASAVAVEVALAEHLRENPVSGLRIMIVSCGAEEVVQGGIYSFAERHFPELELERTWFLVLETLGSPILALVEGEGPVVMEDYPDKRFRDLVFEAARGLGVPLRRGLRARNSTDAVIPSHHGYPTAMLVSLDRAKALSNYHLMSDTAENIDYSTVAQALLVSDGVVRKLAADEWL
jgi:Peptidase family M28